MTSKLLHPRFVLVFKNVLYGILMEFKAFFILTILYAIGKISMFCVLLVHLFQYIKELFENPEKQ